MPASHTARCLAPVPVSFTFLPGVVEFYLTTALLTISGFFDCLLVFSGSFRTLLASSLRLSELVRVRVVFAFLTAVKLTLKSLESSAEANTLVFVFYFLFTFSLSSFSLAVSVPTFRSRCRLSLESGMVKLIFYTGAFSTRSGCPITEQQPRSELSSTALRSYILVCGLIKQSLSVLRGSSASKIESLGPNLRINSYSLSLEKVSRT